MKSKRLSYLVETWKKCGGVMGVSFALNTGGRMNHGDVGAGRWTVHYFPRTDPLRPVSPLVALFDPTRTSRDIIIMNSRTNDTSATFDRPLRCVVDVMIWRWALGLSRFGISGLLPITYDASTSHPCQADKLRLPRTGPCRRGARGIDQEISTPARAGTL